MESLIFKLLRFYQERVSVFFRLNDASRGCRFHPSCSEYSRQAIKKYGALKGGLKAVKRIIKCNPLNGGGFDPC